MSEYMHLDANESIFFNRELETIRAKSYDVKYDDNFKMLALLPISMEGDPLDTQITHRVFGRVGVAKMGGGDYATDFPSVDVFGSEVTVKVYPIQASYKYNKDEIARAARANKPLEQMRANAARKAIDKKLNDVAMNGDTVTGATGLFNAPGISSYTVPKGAAGEKTNWETKTADEILADLYGISNYIITSTKGIEIPDVIALPLTSYQLIERKRLSTDSEKTVLNYFLENSKNIKQIVWFNELESIVTGGDSKKAMYCWKNDADHLVLDLPLAYTQEEVFQDGREYVVPCRAKTGGVTIFYPMSVAVGKYI